MFFKFSEFVCIYIIYFLCDDSWLVLIWQEGGFNADDTDWSNLYDLVEPQSRLNSPQKFSGVFPEKDEEGNVDGKQSLENQDGLKVLPFEFIALEACLEAACSCLENEVSTSLIN